MTVDELSGNMSDELKRSRSDRYDGETKGMAKSAEGWGVVKSAARKKGNLP